MIVKSNVSDLDVGDTVVIKKVNSDSPQVLQKFYAMGLYPGVQVYVQHKSPFGDPIAVKVGKSLLSMRLAEASLLSIDEIFEADAISYKCNHATS